MATYTRDIDSMPYAAVVDGDGVEHNAQSILQTKVTESGDGFTVWVWKRERPAVSWQTGMGQEEAEALARDLVSRV